MYSAVTITLRYPISLTDLVVGGRDDQLVIFHRYLLCCCCRHDIETRTSSSSISNRSLGSTLGTRIKIQMRRHTRSCGSNLDALDKDAPCEAPWKFQLAGWHGRCTLRLFNGRVMFGFSDGRVGAGQPRADARVLENPAHPGSVWI